MKADWAVRAGAGALIVVNSKPGELRGSLSEPGIPLPVVGVAPEARIEGQVTVETNTTSSTKVTRNVIAQTTQGDPDDVLVLGAHLDSVEAGRGSTTTAPGSGSCWRSPSRWPGCGPSGRSGSRSGGRGGRAGRLEPLREGPVGRRRRPRSPVTSTSTWSPRRTTPTGSTTATTRSRTPPGSSTSGAGCPSEEVAFDGRSDYGPFMKAGIPAGGIFTGAEDVKTLEQAQRYGGVGNQSVRPVLPQALRHDREREPAGPRRVADAVASIVEKLAFDQGPVR